MRIFYLFILLVLPLQVNSQLYNGLTAEERAYLFHIVKKSPILNENIGRYFDYQGPEITFKSGKLNYDSVELLIINKPELLIIRNEEIAKSSKGLIAEASNKMAVWELNKVLLAKRTSKNLKQYSNEYKIFEDSLLTKLPPNALRMKDDEMKPHPKLISAINPSLSLKDKMAIIESLRFLTVVDQFNILNAINFGVNSYVEKRSREIYQALGGKASEFTNVLVAAGDGSNTAGILEEREKDEKGRWNKGLPKAIGLFPYQLKKQTTGKGKKQLTTIKPLMFTENNFFTVGNNRYTNIHLDVWGYNARKQTTVVLEKNGLTYHLFGAGDTRFLSPDSTFSEGGTFQNTINDLEFNKIADIYDKIYGKRGFDYWIEYNTKKKDATELKIEKLEKEYSDMGYSPITTSTKASRRVKKSKKKAIKRNSGGFDGTPTTSSNKKSRKKLQKEIVYQYGKFEDYRNKIAELEEQKAAAIDLMAQYQRTLDVYKDAMGRHWAEFTEEDGLYTFEDSSTFDIKTQEFKFPASKEAEQFEIRLIAIPTSSLAETADEVMLHINILDAEPNYDARVQVEFNDVFASDKWDLPNQLFTHKDSVALQVFFEGLLNKKTDFNIIVRGQGVGMWDGNRTIKNPKPKELDRYTNTESKETFALLRRSELFVHMDRAITLEVNSYTDPVKSNLGIDGNELFTNAMTKYGLTKNDILSAYRSYAILNAFKTEMNVLAGKYLPMDQARIVIDRFNKKMDRAKISVGRTSFKLNSFK